MKNVIAIIFIVFLFSCQSNEVITPSKESVIKAENFMAGKKDTKSRHIYITKEALEAGKPIIPNMVSMIPKIQFKYDNGRYQEGAMAFEDLLNEITQKANLDVKDLIDIQLLTYVQLETMLFEMENPDRKMIANSLERLYRYTDPLEVRVIGRALQYAKPHLDRKKYNEISQRINHWVSSEFSELDNMTESLRNRLVNEGRPYLASSN